VYAWAGHISTVADGFKKAYIGNPERILTSDLFLAERQLLYATSALMVLVAVGVVAILHGLV
jgi:hypothetical protein